MYQNNRLIVDDDDDGGGGSSRGKRGYEFYSFSWNVLGGLPSG